MSYYQDKEKNEPGSVNRNEVGPKKINDPLFDTDLKDKKPGEGSEPLQDDPSVKKDYDSSKNAGGSKSATENPEQ